MFKWAKILTILAIFVALTISFRSAISSFANSETPEKPVQSEIENDSKITVYYFYSKPRCISCKKIETYTEEAVNSLKNSEIEFKKINLDLPENKHYAKDYNLYTKSVVLSKVKNNEEIKSKNLIDIWTKLNNEEKFKDYIKKEIKDFGG